MPPSRSDKPAAQRFLQLGIRVGLSAVIVTFLMRKLSWESLNRLFHEMHLGLVVIAFITLQIGQSFSSWRWKLIAEPLGFHEKYARFRTLFYIGSFFNLFLPTSIGGDAVRAWMLAPDKQSRLAAFGSVIADRVAGVTAMLMMACLATFTPLGEIPWYVPVLPWVILAGLLCTLALLPRLTGYSPKVTALLNGFGWEQGRWDTWWKALGLSFVVQALATLQVILLGIALDLPVPWLAYLVVVPLVTLLTMLPISLNGFGVREGALVLLLANYGVTEEQAVALGVTWLTLSIGVGLIGGFFFLLNTRHSKPIDNTLSTEGNDSHEPIHRRADEGRTGQRQAAA